MDPIKIGDTLVDHNAVRKMRIEHMHSSMDTYDKANILLGYFSQLHEYSAEFESLTGKIMIYRGELLQTYKEVLHDHQDIYKILLMPPMMTKSYADGVKKFKSIKKYSIYFYKKRVGKLLNAPLDNTTMGELINTILGLDRYYEIYDETLGAALKNKPQFEGSDRSVQL